MTDEVASMRSVNVGQLAQEQLDAARAASSGRSTTALFGERGSRHRQVLLALAKDRTLSEHENPGEATLHVIVGRVRLRAGEVSWEGGPGDHLVIPQARHDVLALEDSAVILTVAHHA